MSKQRWRLEAMRQHDTKYGDCAVRELEMIVDNYLDPLRVVQFWRDIELYGINEALAYVESGDSLSEERMERLRKETDQVVSRLNNPPQIDSENQE